MQTDTRVGQLDRGKFPHDRLVTSTPGAHRIGVHLGDGGDPLGGEGSQGEKVCLVTFVTVSISSRTEGTSRRSTCEKKRAISSATFRRRRSACTKSTAERKRAWRKMVAQNSKCLPELTSVRR